MFNYWRNYPKRKPTKDGLYLCTIDMGAGIHIVKQLWYNTRQDKWINKERLSVFNMYDVYRCCLTPNDENRVIDDELCDRTDDVIYWRMLPKTKKGKLDKKDCANLSVW